MSTLIEVKQLFKHYADTTAVNGISFKVRQGSCYGLLGPNGAGKTTTMEIIEDIIPASSGEVLYHGEKLDKHFKSQIGIQFQSTALQDYQTVIESLQMFAALYENTSEINMLVDLCHLEEFLDRDTQKLSGGQRQRLLLAIALINNPELVFLDEPTTGLDPQSRRNFWDLIEKVKSEGKTILLTTHYMEEAYRLCDTIAIIDKGKIICEGKPDDLLNEHFPPNIIRFQTETEFAIPESMIKTENHYEWFSNDVQSSIHFLESQGISLDDCHITRPTLEDLFLKLTGHALRN